MNGRAMAPALWQRLGCCLTGHDYAITSDETRIFLRCKNCGHSSRGMVMAEDPHRRRAGGARAPRAAAANQPGPSGLSAN